MSRGLREVELYGPVKAFLGAQGYEVKGEIGAADVVAIRGDEPPVIVELKTGFSLALFHQGIARQAITDAVYLAVPAGGTRKALAANVSMARRLGLGVMTVRARDGFVTVLADPGPYQPRQSKIRRERLLRAFARRQGDPLAGGSARAGIVTAYRRDAVTCAAHLAAQGPCSGAEIKQITGVEQATRIMANDHYGWFIRIERGIYDLTDAGRAGLKAYSDRI